MGGEMIELFKNLLSVRKRSRIMLKAAGCTRILKLAICTDV